MENDIRDQVRDMLAELPGAAESGNRVTIRPRATGRALRLRANRNGKGYVTSYTLPIGCAEAAEAGFLGPDKQPLTLEKVVDAANHTITFRLVEPTE